MAENTEYGAPIFDQISWERIFPIETYTPLNRKPCKDRTYQVDCSKNGGDLDCSPKTVTYNCQNGTTENKTEFDAMCPQGAFSVQANATFPPCGNAGGIKKESPLIPENVQSTVEDMLHYYSNTDKLALLGVVAVGLILLIDNE